MKKVALIAISLLLLLYAGAGNYYQIHHPSVAVSDTSDKIPDTQDSETTIIAPNIFYSMVQVLHPVFHADLALEFDLPVISETKAHSIIETSLNFTQFYRTLFRAIISPNAP
ncbi:MAG: hypothetical protein U5K79_04475 [Cyclobacteriaceae bacterium]|nr:hypothetical protein [Cyclobacteriaceae bacterium]